MSEHDKIIAEARKKYTVHNCNQCEYRKSCDLNANGYDSNKCREMRQSIMLGFGIEDGYFTKLLDGLEAAHKREVGVVKTETTTEKSSAVGNNAKMREALVKIRLLLSRVPLSIKSDVACGIIAAKVKFALAAPPRNCDRFASAEEAWDAYDEWVASYRAKGKTEPLNEYGWLFAEAKEGGAE